MTLKHCVCWDEGLYCCYCDQEDEDTDCRGLWDECVQDDDPEEENP